MSRSSAPENGCAEHGILDRFTKFAELGAELFRDPLSENSRKRQTALLVVSVLAILLSFGTVQVPNSGGTVSAFGFAFTISSAMTIKHIFGVLSLYFLAAYFMSLIQDLTAARYRRAPLLAYVRQLSGETIRWITLRAEKTDLAVKCLDLFGKLSEIRDRYQGPEAQRRREVGDLESQIDAGDIETSVWNEHEARVKALRAIEEQREAEEQPINQQLTVYRERMVELDAAEKDSSKRPLKGELEQYVGMYEKYRVVDLWRFLLEGVVPLLLGVYASWRGLVG